MPAVLVPPWSCAPLRAPGAAPCPRGWRVNAAWRPGCWLLLLAIALAGAGSAGLAAAATPPRPVSTPDRVPREYIVRLATNAGPGVLSRIYGDLGIRRLQSLGGSLYLLTVATDPGPEEMGARAATTTAIKRIAPNYVYPPKRPPAPP